MGARLITCTSSWKRLWRRGVTAGFEHIRLPHRALPEMALREVDLTTVFLGHELAAPFLISSMAGGTPEAMRVNHRLARAAQASGLAMGMGSLRAAVEYPALAESYPDPRCGSRHPHYSRISVRCSSTTATGWIRRGARWSSSVPTA